MDEPPPFPHRRSCRTVLAGKGPLRRAKPARPCPLRAVPQNLADMRERGHNAKFSGGEFSTGEVGKFKPALTPSAEIGSDTR